MHEILLRGCWMLNRLKEGIHTRFKIARVYEGFIDILNNMDSVRWLGPFRPMRWRCSRMMQRKCNGCRCQWLLTYYGWRNKLIRLSDFGLVSTFCLHINNNVTATLLSLGQSLLYENALYDYMALGVRMLVWLLFGLWIKYLIAFSASWQLGWIHVDLLKFHFYCLRNGWNAYFVFVQT